MKKRFFYIITIFVITIVCLTSCSQSLNNKSYYTAALNTGISWKAEFPDTMKEKDADDIWSNMTSIISDYEKRYSTYETTSFIYKFNNAAPGAEIVGTKEDYDIFTLCKDVYNETSGLFNPAIYILSRFWGFAGDNSINKNLEVENESNIVIPTEDNLNLAFSLTSFLSITCEKKSDGKYYFTKPDTTVEIGGITYSMQIDYSGILKGYIAGKLAKEIYKTEAKYGYISLGSSSISVFEKDTNGSYWNLEVKDPRNSNSAYLSIPVKNVLFSTSGDYESYFEKSGVRYCHIISPRTKAPVQTGIISASVMYTDVDKNESPEIEGALSDAYATAIMAMDIDLAKRFITSRDLKATVCYKDGDSIKVFTTMDNTNLTNYEYC